MKFFMYICKNINMEKIFQPKVKEIANEFIQILTETDFFTDHEIESTDYAYNYICEKLTDKFIENGLDEENGIFTIDEINEMSREIIAGSLLEQLKKKGYINSFEDEDDEEKFFLTDLGKEYVKKLKENENEETDE